MGFSTLPCSCDKTAPTANPEAAQVTRVGQDRMKWARVRDVVSRRLRVLKACWHAGLHSQWAYFMSSCQRRASWVADLGTGTLWMASKFDSSGELPPADSRNPAAEENTHFSTFSMRLWLLSVAKIWCQWSFWVVVSGPCTTISI